MAVTDVITSARLVLDEQVTELALLVRVLESCNTDNPPDWLALFYGRVVDLEKAYDRVVDLEKAYDRLCDVLHGVSS